MWVPTYNWALLEFLTLRFAHTKSLAIHQLWFRFFCPALVSAVASCGSLYFHDLSLQFWGQLFAV